VHVDFSLATNWADGRITPVSIFRILSRAGYSHHSTQIITVTVIML